MAVHHQELQTAWHYCNVYRGFYGQGRSVDADERLDGVFYWQSRLSSHYRLAHNLDPFDDGLVKQMADSFALPVAFREESTFLLGLDARSQ